MFSWSRGSAACLCHLACRVDFTASVTADGESFYLGVALGVMGCILSSYRSFHLGKDRSCIEIGSGDVPGKLSQGITVLLSPTFFLFPSLPPSPVSLPPQTEGDAFSLPGSHYCIFLTAHRTVSLLILPDLGASKALKAARLWVHIPAPPIYGWVFSLSEPQFPHLCMMHTVIPTLQGYYDK